MDQPMDQLMKLIKPGRQFAKDSIRLVKRCTKPDRRGIPENRCCNCHWFLHYGIHRIFCETNPHTY
ncbi:unnamed protein product [Acanthoscelides obtectus]|uniref:Uncharacterized protein n=1 Tax=Acanthoscelides obtectus TaxID=200917 RepID=A0A9P0LUI1_ACAOB|nr:unnamed protein product [Acanthoscelides obtectus]CAK1666956.1 Protein transport protein Sec61 subunit gamma [Acanthoscelides obtectus]